MRSTHFVLLKIQIGDYVPCSHFVLFQANILDNGLTVSKLKVKITDQIQGRTHVCMFAKRAKRFVYLRVGSNFMTTLQTSNIKFTQLNIDNVFETLISTDNVLKEVFDNYIKDEYKDNKDERLNYFDIAEISRYLIDRLKNRQTENFDAFFDAVENILNNCDTEIENLIVIGLYEGIQNIGGPEINYYTSFDKWLKPVSKLKWEKLIDFWEGKDWRTNKK